MLVVTTDSIPGYAVKNVLGAIDVHILNIVPRLTLAVLRERAWKQLGEHAANYGANAVVGVRMESLMQPAGGFTHPYGVCVYGTAIVIEAVDSWVSPA